METHKSEVDEVENASTASNASLVWSMLQRLRKDESSRSLHLSSLGVSTAEGNSLSGADNDQEASSRKFNTQVPAEKHGNAEDSPTVIPKWERRQLFLRPLVSDIFGEDEHHPSGERDKDLRGCKTKTRFEASLTVSETQERMYAHEIQMMMPLHENSSHIKDMCNVNPSNISQIKENSGTVESVARENTENEIYEDVLLLSSMDESLSQSTDEMQPNPSPVQTHNTLISNTSCNRIRKVKLCSDFQTQTQSCVVTSTKTWSDDQPLKTPKNENITDSGMGSEDIQRRTHSTVQDPSLKRGVTGSTGSNTSLGKVSDKWRNATDITEKLKEMWREMSESTQDKESLYLEPDPQSVEETMISPTTFYEEQEPSEVKTHLQRTFTLCDFKLDLGSMNLMDEVFTGDEWSKYLPVQKCPSQEEDTDYSKTSSVHACSDNEMSVIVNLEHRGLKPEGYSGSLHSCGNTDLQRMVIEEDQDDLGVESSTYIYAIQMEDEANPAEKKTNPSSYQGESEDIYDYVEYMIPMPSNWENTKSTHFLDFSVIKSQELLDNSILKSRISLGRKRKYRPPGKRGKEKSSSTFYNIPSSVLQPPTQLLPSACSPSPSPTPAVFSSSVFYARPSISDSQTLSQSLGSVTEKSKPKWKGLFPKTKGKAKH